MGKSASGDNSRGGFYGGTISRVDGEKVFVNVPHLAGDLEVELAHYTGSPPGSGEDIFVSFLNGLPDELAATFPGAGGKIEFDVLIAAHNAPSGVRAAADFVCDGVDDEKEFQAAVEFIEAGSYGNEPPSGRVRVSGGDFSLSGPVSFSYDTISTVMFVGSGNGITRISIGYTPDPGDVAVFNVNKTAWSMFKDMSISFDSPGPLPNRFAVISTNYEYWATVHLQNVSVSATGQNEAGTIFCDAVYAYVATIEDSDVTASGACVTNASSLFVQGSTLESLLGNAAESSTPYYHNQSWHVTHSSVSALGNGLSVSDAGKLLVTGTSFSTGGSALAIGFSQQLLAIGNIFGAGDRTSAGPLLGAETLSEAVIRGNVFDGSDGDGILVTGPNQYDIAITGNAMTNIVGAGISLQQAVYDSLFLVVSSNSIESGSGPAVIAGGFRHVTINSNDLYVTGATAITLDGASEFSVRKNKIVLLEAP